jgi:hypothetical protein
MDFHTIKTKPLRQLKKRKTSRAASIPRTWTKELDNGLVEVLVDSSLMNTFYRYYNAIHKDTGFRGKGHVSRHSAQAAHMLLNKAHLATRFLSGRSFSRTINFRRKSGNAHNYNAEASRWSWQSFS